MYIWLIYVEIMQLNDNSLFFQVIEYGFSFEYMDAKVWVLIWTKVKFVWTKEIPEFNWMCFKIWPPWRAKCFWISHKPLIVIIRRYCCVRLTTNKVYDWAGWIIMGCYSLLEKRAATHPFTFTRKYNIS